MVRNGWIVESANKRVEGVFCFPDLDGGLHAQILG